MLEEVGFQAGAPLAERKVLAFAPEALPLRLDTELQVRAALMGLLQVRHFPLRVVFSTLAMSMGLRVFIDETGTQNSKSGPPSWACYGCALMLRLAK